MQDYYKDDEYWKENIDKDLDDDKWIEAYTNYFKKGEKCLDLACGVGQYTKFFKSLGLSVTSADISEIALNKVKEFNEDIVNFDMRNKFPFDNNTYDLVYANLGIHYFSDIETKQIIKEINRILKKDGYFIGSVNALGELDKYKDIAIEIETMYYKVDKRFMHFFTIDSIKEYLKSFSIIKIEEISTTKYKDNKNFIIFICKKI